MDSLRVFVGNVGAPKGDTKSKTSFRLLVGIPIPGFILIFGKYSNIYNQYQSMAKHNNVIGNTHLRKHWQRNVVNWLGQASRHNRRLLARKQKAQRVAPRPIDQLRPVVRGTTIRFNNKTRFGKGFSLAEIKAAGLSVAFARSIGIAVDARRQNRSQESLDLNKARLTAYLNRLVLYPRHEKKLVTKAKGGIINDTPKENQQVNDRAVVNTRVPLVKRVKALPSSDLAKLRKQSAYRTLRQEWSNQRNNGRRLKKAEDAKNAQKN